MFVIISSIIFKDNKTYLYGLNTFGQLGNGSKRYKAKKLSIIPLLSPIKFMFLNSILLLYIIYQNHVGNATIDISNEVAINTSYISNQDLQR